MTTLGQFLAMSEIELEVMQIQRLAERRQEPGPRFPLSLLLKLVIGAMLGHKAPDEIVLS